MKLTNGKDLRDVPDNEEIKVKIVKGTMFTPSQKQGEWKAKISKALDIYDKDKEQRPEWDNDGFPTAYGISPKDAAVIVLSGIFEQALSQYLQTIEQEIEKDKTEYMEREDYSVLHVTGLNKALSIINRYREELERKHYE